MINFLVRVRIRLILLTLASAGLYGLLALRSDAPRAERLLANRYNPEMFEASVEFLLIWVALVAIYLVGVRVAASRNDAGLLAIIFISSVLFRAAMLLGSGFDVSEPRAFLFTPNPLGTTAAHLGLPPTIERLIVTLADLVGLALTPALLRTARLPAGAAILHGWNPLVIKEAAGSGRLEIVAFVLLLVALRLAQKGARWADSIVWGASLAGPMLLLGFLPRFARAVGVRAVAGLAVGLAAWELAFPGTPWLDRAGWPIQNYLGGSITPAFVSLASLFVTRNASIPLAAAFACWAALIAVRAARGANDDRLPMEALIAVGGVLFVCPQVLPWAFVVVAYLAAFSKNRGWLGFTITAPLTYVALDGGSWSFWLGFAQYFLPYAALIFFWLGSQSPRR